MIHCTNKLGDWSGGGYLTHWKGRDLKEFKDRTLRVTFLRSDMYHTSPTIARTILVVNWLVDLGLF